LFGRGSGVRETLIRNSNISFEKNIYSSAPNCVRVVVAVVASRWWWVEEEKEDKGAKDDT